MKGGNKIVNSIQIKSTVVKGVQNDFQGSNLNANSMAQIQSQKMKEQEGIKKERIQTFMNSTKINASKLYKEKVVQNQQQLLSKKEKLQKQKQLKSRYTIIPKKDETEKIQVLAKEPMHVNWKQAEDVLKKVQIPEEKLNYQSSGEESGYDSEVDPEKTQNPIQVIQENKKIRQYMLTKLKR